MKKRSCATDRSDRSANPPTPRKTRRTYNTLGDAHELTFSCFRRLPLLDSDGIRRVFLNQLNKARERWDFELWAYVLMPEHVHLLVWPKSRVYDIAAIRKSIKQSVPQRAVHYMRRRQPDALKAFEVLRQGVLGYRFWQEGGGYDRNLFSPRAIAKVIDYIHNNPVRRGLVATPIEWPWSSARWYAGLDVNAIEVDPCPVVRMD